MLYQQHMHLRIDAEMMPNPEQEEVDHDAVISVVEFQEKAFKKAETKAQKQERKCTIGSISKVSFLKDRKFFWRIQPRSSTKEKSLMPGLDPTRSTDCHLGKGIYELVNEKGKI